MNNLITKPTIHNKAWGSEEWIINNNLYCGKLLNFNEGAKFSMHFHMRKTETWYVLSGLFELIIINTANANKESLNLHNGDIITITPGMPHQLIAKEKGTILEISTTHYEEDSYRVEKGDSQK